MKTWRKEGVCGDLNNFAQKCYGRIARLYHSKGVDFFVTAIRDGNHMPGSFHFVGGAFDFLYADLVSKDEIRKAAGPGFDIVFHKGHIHIEHDPKG